MAFGLQDTSCATLFAPILLIATAIGAILNNIRAVANATGVGNRFLDRASSLPITYYSPTTKFFMYHNENVYGKMPSAFPLVTAWVRFLTPNLP